MAKVACVGARDINQDQEKFLEDIGADLIQRGYYIASGNAKGSDQAFQRGGNRIDPTKVMLYLPWPSYNKEAIVEGNIIITKLEPHWLDEASIYHPVWDKLSHTVKMFMARNVGIWEGSTAGIANPFRGKPGLGGTGHGMRYGAANGIRVIDLSAKEDFQRVWRKIYGI